MCQEEQPRARRLRHRREGVVVLLVTAIAMWIAVIAYVRAEEQRRLECVRAIQMNGGSVFSPSWLDNIRMWQAGLGWDSDSFVSIGERIDSQWIADHDFLSELSITTLAVDGNYLDSAAVIRLIECHPIDSLSANCQTGADAIAGAVANDTDFTGFCVRGSDLTDAGFRRLPLKQLESLAIAESRVTPEALSDELRRCRRLTWIDMDGNQLDSQVAGELEELPSLNSIMLFGRTITDDHLRIVEAVEQLTYLSLYATSATSEAVDRFRQANPSVTVYVIDHDPPPCPGTTLDTSD